MTQDAFNRYLDNPEQRPQEGDALELAMLFESLQESDHSEDPGQGYWNQFNHRLQNRLEQEAKPKRFGWFRPSLAFAGVAAVLLFAFLKHDQPAADPEKTLASLDMEYLSIIGEMYASPILDSDPYEFADQDLELLLEVTDPIFDDPFSNLDQLDLESWNPENREG